MRREPKSRVHERSNTVTIEIQGDLVASADKDMDAAFREACEYSLSNILLKFHDKSLDSDTFRRRTSANDIMECPVDRDRRIET
jgi:hypothetical protein